MLFLLNHVNFTHFRWDIREGLKVLKKTRFLRHFQMLALCLERVHR